MSDFMVMGDGGTGHIHTSEHYLKRVLVGDRDSVQQRLLNALQRLGYDILDDDENTIRGRRGPRGWGTSYSSADVLDYPMTLIVKLKENGPNATRATFDYVVKHPSLSGGEKEILTREAEAISSLATVRAAEKTCPACGTESTDDSRFCRRCGTQISIENSELEVLRMSAEVRAGHTSIVSSAVTATISSLLMSGVVIAIGLNGMVLSKGIFLLLIAGIITSWLSVLCISFGWNRVNRALKTRRPENPTFMDGNMPALKGSEQFVPADRGMIPSVTEGTTNLLAFDIDSRKTGDFSDENRTGKMAG
ncbi:hypothetical protein BH10ACI2_BH10ACI2_22390 [soil metagenome]